MSEYKTGDRVIALGNLTRGQYDPIAKGSLGTVVEPTNDELTSHMESASDFYKEMFSNVAREMFPVFVHWDDYPEDSVGHPFHGQRLWEVGHADV